ncbi:hypothetical protein AB4Z14_21590 [Terrabacter sp. 2TAF16]|jgi:hypothetical protein|uniref:hypothetical protein n=1 Tax=unclassified Terrabacter TaxID=2630222 RepID=UPI003F94C334
MTPGEVLVPGAIAIVFVVAWFVVGVIDATRPDSDTPQKERVPHPVRETTHAHRG